jgi:hypothetical protein
MARDPIPQDVFNRLVLPKIGVTNTQVQDDYIQARGDVDKFYNTNLIIQEDLYDRCSGAVQDFRHIHDTIAGDGLPGNVLYQLIRVALGILPGAGLVLDAFDRLAKGLHLAASASRLATMAGVTLQRAASGIFNQANAELDKSKMHEFTHGAVLLLDKLEGKSKETILAEQSTMIESIDQFKKHAMFSGNLRELVALTHGAQIYNSRLLDKMRANYELELYLHYYKDKITLEMWIGSRFSHTVLDGMPAAVQRRIAKLAKVSPHRAFWRRALAVKTKTFRQSAIMWGLSSEETPHWTL